MLPEGEYRNKNSVRQRNRQDRCRRCAWRRGRLAAKFIIDRRPVPRGLIAVTPDEFRRIAARELALREDGKDAEMTKPTKGRCRNTVDEVEGTDEETGTLIISTK